MIIAVPMVQGKLSLHFGHCESFRLFEVDKDKVITKFEDKTPPPHEPGVLPKWLSDEKANVIITGGMGMHAQRLFSQYGVQVVVGAAADNPENIVKSWLAGDFVPGANPCDH